MILSDVIKYGICAQEWFWIAQTKENVVAGGVDAAHRGTSLARKVRSIGPQIAGVVLPSAASNFQ
jgi:hypothetical protein